MLQNYCTLVADNDHFVYFNGGVLTLDDRAPRRSCMFDESDSDKWLAKAKKAINKQIDYVVKGHTSFSSTPHWAQRPQQEKTDIMAGWQRRVDELKNRQYRVVKVTFTDV